jgi:pilus assembly protein CpaE
MLAAMLIGPEDALMRDCKDKLAGLLGVSIGHHAYRYPSPGELAALLDQFQPDALIVSLADYTQVCRAISRLNVDRPHLPVIALSTVCDQGLLLDLMQLGVRELWFEPLKVDQMQAAVSRLLRLKTAVSVAVAPTGTLLAFLPARGGCGTTTIAVNTAAAMQRLKASVLLADFDFHNSVIAFWLKLDPRHGFQEALERAHWLDPTLWKSMVHPVEGLHVLTSPQAGLQMVFSSAETTAVLDFARQHYEYVLVDLPDAIYSSCWEVLDRATQVMMVITPEMASLYLARRKVSQLVNHGISRERLRILLNRASHSDIQAGEVEKFLGLPVLASFQNQYRVVTSALAEGRFVSEGSNVGDQFQQFARSLTGAPPEVKEKASPVRKLRQIFSPA